MKSESEAQAYLDGWAAAAPAARDDYEAGIVVGTLLAIKTLLGDDDDEIVKKAKAGIAAAVRARLAARRRRQS